MEGNERKRKKTDVPDRAEQSDRAETYEQMRIDDLLKQPDPWVRDLIREEEEYAGKTEDDMVFICDGCDKAVRGGETCLIVPDRSANDCGGGTGTGGTGGPSAGIPLRLCRHCAEAEDTLAGWLDMLGFDYFSGTAEDGERWLTANR